MLLNRLKANALTRSILILVAIGQPKQGLNEKAQAKGSVGFLQKPIEKSALLVAIKQVLTIPATPNKPACVPLLSPPNRIVPTFFQTATHELFVSLAEW